ncbi:hypothetical protein ABPG75_002908 [Micractinium tetrahymenae]
MFGLGSLFCWGTRRRKDREDVPQCEGGKRRSRRRHRYIHAKAGHGLAPVRLGCADGALGSGSHAAAGLSPTSDRMSMAFSACLRCCLCRWLVLRVPCLVSQASLRGTCVCIACLYLGMVPRQGLSSSCCFSALPQPPPCLLAPTACYSVNPASLFLLATCRASCRAPAGDSEYHDALEELGSFSSRASGDDSHLGSPNGSHTQRSEGEEEQPGGLLDRIALWWEGRRATTTSTQQHGGGGAAGSEDVTPTPRTGTAMTPRSPLSQQQQGLPPDEVIEPSPPDGHTGCMNLFTAAHVGMAQKRFLRLGKPPAGSSFRRRTAEEAPTLTAAAWEPADGTTFSVRSLNYMRTKVKEPSGPCIYQLLGVDIYSFDFKLFHIAQHIQLPDPPRLGPEALALPQDQQLPPLLIINLQLPFYGPSLFGSNDGQGHSLVYYFALPEGWEPSQMSNQAALALVQRFMHNKREFDGTPTRDRFKLIPRIVNVAEWAEKGPLSGYEHRLLMNYNDKPLLTRPQQRFYTGPNYLEIDMDVHNYAFIARKAFHGFIHRLAPVVFENAFVVQGNRPEELPEQVLAAARVYRVDFTKARPFPARSVEDLGNGTGPEHDGEAARR